MDDLSALLSTLKLPAFANDWRQVSEEFEKQMNEFLISVKEYQKNKYVMPEGDRLEINNILNSWMAEKNYSLD